MERSGASAPRHPSPAPRARRCAVEPNGPMADVRSRARESPECHRCRCGRDRAVGAVLPIANIGPLYDVLSHVAVGDRHPPVPSPLSIAASAADDLRVIDQDGVVFDGRPFVPDKRRRLVDRALQDRAGDALGDRQVKDQGGGGSERTASTPRPLQASSPAPPRQSR